MKISALTLLHIALGATGASALVIAFTHFFWTVPLWAGAISVANLSLPPVSPGDVQNYLGMLLGAVVTAGIGFNAWLAAYYKLQRENGDEVPIAWKLIPLLLLVPCVVHFVGLRSYTSKTIAQNQAVVDQYRLQKMAARGE